MTRTDFIGRTKELEKLRDLFYFRHDGEQQDRSQWLSINGPHNIGKTYLAQIMMEEFEKNPISNTYCVYFVVPTTPKFDPKIFWNGFFSEIFDKIPEEDEKNIAAQNNNMVFWVKKLHEARSFFSENACWSLSEEEYIHRIRGFIRNVFKSYTQLGIHLILVLDEFDVMKSPGSLESIDCLFQVSNKVANFKDYKNINFIFISRRTFKAIVEKYDSEFHSSFNSIPTKTLHGFNDDEMEQYFKSYEKLPIGIPNEDLKKLILYFCGKHPGLLIECREKLRNSKDIVSQQKVFKDSFVTNEYERLRKLIKENNSMDDFFQAYIWQPYDENIDFKLITMEANGFISRCEENATNMYKWLEYGQQPYGMSKGYEPLSLYFVDYMKINVRTEDLKNFSGILCNTDLCVRKMIKEAMIKKYQDKYEQEIMNFVIRIGKESFYQSFESSVQENYANERGVPWSPLDILAFHNYADIIKSEWDVMKEYFLAYSNPKKLKEDFDFLTDSRNIDAHKNGRILLDSKMTKAHDICNKILYSRIEKSFDFKDTMFGILIFYNKFQNSGWISSEFSFFDDFGKNEIKFENVMFDDSGIDTRGFVYLINYLQDNQKNIVSIDIVERFERKKNMQWILRCSCNELNATLIDFSKPAKQNQTIDI